MRVLVAPDKFKGTLSASAAAAAIAEGWQRGDPATSAVQVPMADGGEGTLDVLVQALGGSAVPVRVTGPLGEPVDARFGLVRTGALRTAVVEMAAASGLGLVPESLRDPTVTSTRGTGELMAAAARAGVDRILVAVGGSATNDAGAGLAQAVGFRLLDEIGRQLGPGGAELLRLERIDAGGVDRALRDIEIVVATDVDNPLIGPEGASAVYGPQKGASAADVQLLDRAMSHFARIARRDLGADVATIWGGGAAGGLGAGLVAFLGATLVRGGDLVADAVGLDDRIREADLVVTGEGSFDAQSLRGKGPGVVIQSAAHAGVPAVVLCGTSDGSLAGGDVLVASMADRFGVDAALSRPEATLARLAAEVAGALSGDAASLGSTARGIP